MTRIILIAAVLSALAVPATARPGLSEDRVVHSRDLDLGSPAGVERLRTRVASAAQQVCEARPRGDSLLFASRVARCRAALVAHTEPQVTATVARARDWQVAASGPRGAAGTSAPARN